MEIGNGSRKTSEKEVRTFFFFFFFFCFSLLKMTKICFGSTKMGIFYREKAFHVGKKIRKDDFAPSEKYACYAPVVHYILFVRWAYSVLFFHLLYHFFPLSHKMYTVREIVLSLKQTVFKSLFCIFFLI